MTEPEEKPIQEGILKFDLDCEEGRKAMLRALNADKAYRVLTEVQQAVFRPARKHGYPDPKLAAMVRGIDELLGQAEGDYDETVPSASNLIGLLEEKFFEVLREEGVDLEDYA